MLGSRLARRIVVPLLLLILALFALLAFAAVRVAERSVARELEDEADRIAATLAELPVTPEHRPEIFGALARLVGTELVVEGYASRPEWPEAQVARVSAGSAELGGRGYRVLARRFGSRGETCFVLFDEERIAQRRRDALVPVAVAGAVGLLVALVLGLVVARAIARPVKGLADRVAEFGAGRDVAVGERGPGEIGELQDAFARMTREIREGERKLRESERLAALGRLAGGIAHELRNPLTAIRMAIETSTTADGEARAEARRVALAEIDRLDRTLRELLDFVRPRKPKREEIDADVLLGEVAELLRPQCEHLSVRLDVDGNGKLEGDRDRLKQALINLVLNAAQAQPKGGVVRLRARSGVVEVEDEGPGIDPEIREMLFQPFVTTKAAGIGIGLAVVKQVADEHGARLEFDTGLGGTTFRMRFPP